MATGSDYGLAIASAAATSMGNYAVNVAANKKQFKYQKEAMAIQDQYNRELWNYQNAYNTPAAQMERLKAAGLNPHLIYGGGSGNAGNAGPIASLDVPSRQAARPEIPDLALRRLQVRQMDAQYAATTQNVETAKKRAMLMDVQTGLQNLKLMNEGIRSKNFKDLAQAEIDTKKFIALRSAELFANERTKGTLMDQLSVMRAKQMTGIELDNTFKTYRNDLAKLGIYSSDHPAFRILIQSAERIGIDLGSLLAQGAEKLMYLLKD